MAAWQISSTRRAAPRRKSRKSSNLTPRALRLEPFEERILFDIGLVAVIPSAGSVLSNAQVLNSAPTELTFRFDSNVDAATLDQNPTLSGIQLRRAGADTAFGTQDDVYVVPSYIAVGEKPNEVIVRFAQTASSRPFIYPDGTTIPDNVPLLDPTLPNGLYQIHIVGSGAEALKDTDGDAFNGGVDFNQTFNLELGAQILSIVPQPITRGAGNVLTQATNQIDVYFNVNDPLNVGSAQTTTFYQLIRTTDGNDQAVNQIVINPISVSYSAATGKAVLTFAANVLTTAGIYRLRIGNSDPLPMPTIDLGTGTSGSSLATAQNIGTQFPFLQGTQSVSIDGTILPIPVTTLYPGGNNEPGTRTVSPQLHVGNTPGTGDLAPIKYNFKQDVGTVLGAPATNSIRTSPEQMRRVREVLSYYSYYLGVEFVETEDEGWTIATSDIRVVNPDVLPNAVRGLAGNNLVVMSNSFEWGDNEAGGDFFVTAMHGIGTLLGLGDTYELPALAVQGTGVALQDTTSGEGVFPGDSDILLGQYLHPPVGNDIDVYRFALPRAGQLNLETFAQRLAGLSSTEFQLDSVITVFDVNGKLIARNDDYYGNDSFLQLQLNTGAYYVVVTSTGNTNFDPTITNTGFGGTTHGRYELKLTFTPTAPSGIRDTAGTILDGDGDGAPGGANNFWFRVAAPAQTFVVDKAAPGAGIGTGTLANPFKNIADALNMATAGSVVRIVGNGGSDSNLATIGNNLSYNIGFDNLGNALSDGSKFEVPRGVTVMIDAGAIIKLRGANIDVGSSAQGIDRDSGALQVLGVPTGQLNDATDAGLRDDVGAVYFTSYYTTGIGTDPGTAKDAAPVAGNWGGLVFRNDPNLTLGGPDLEAAGIFLNSVNNANLSYGGGKVIVNSVEQSFAAIHLVTSRPSVSFNTISRSADAAVSADPNSFQESDFRGIRLEGAFTTDYTRSGPKVYGNTLSDNSINGLFVRIRTDDGRVLDPLTVSARFSTTDMTYVINENLEIAGNPGGALDDGFGNQISRLAARLAIDPGVIVKLGGARIETQIGSQFIAEGTAARPIIFTSVFDDSFGSGGSFDATNDNRLGAPTPAAEGNWGGLFFGPLSIASLDSALVTYAGGNTTIEGGFATFNALEIHQADARIANTTFRHNAGGGGDDRNGRSSSTRSVIFVRGAQPVLIDNVIENNDESAQGDPSAQSTAAISINVNSLNYKPVTDMGRSVGFANIQSPSLTNTGPLIRGNRLDNNPVNGLVVRGGEITTNLIWDDTDIVHVLFDEIVARNQFSINGTLRLQSTSAESLVVKMFGPTAGFTAGGTPLDINDRIGGTVQVVGTPNHPVFLTSLFDDTVGAGFTPGGAAQTDTDNQGTDTGAAPGDWRSIKLDTYSNDTNVDLINESEQKFSPAGDTNNLPTTAQFIGALAKDSKSGDDVQRLGFEIHGSISQTVANNLFGDVDVYSFRGTAGSAVWFDIDRTASSLDTVVELIDANGSVIARSDNSWTETGTPAQLVGIAKPLQVGYSGTAGPFASPDFYSTNPLDAGMRLELPGTAGTVNTYFVRVRASSTDLSRRDGGLTKGTYQLQVRLQDADVVPGSVVRNADIRFATNGVEIIGKPERSPLMGDTAETSNVHNTFDTAQDLGNLLASDTGAISVAGSLGIGDVDWYKFDLNYDLIQSIGGASDFGKLFPAMFQINYADGLSRPDTTLSVFDQNGNLIFIGRDSDNPDSQPRSSMGADTTNLNHGSFGTLDPTIGTVQLPAGSPIVPGSPTGERFTYYVAVSAANRLPTILNATFVPTATNPQVRLEALSSVTRVVDDSIGSAATPAGQQAFPGTTPTELNTAATPYSLADVVAYVGTIDQLYTINPFTGQVTTLVTESNGRRANERLPDFGDTGIGDLAMRPDGRLMSMASGDTAGKNGTYFQINTGDGSQVTAGQGGIGGVNPINANDVTEDSLIIPPGNGQPRTYSYEVPDSDFGINVNGMAFGDTLFGLPGSSLLYVVGNRTAGNGTIFDTQNLLFRLDPNTGAPFDTDIEANRTFNSGNPVYQPFPGNTSGPNPLGPRSGTPVIPRGVLNTGTTILTKSGANLADGATFTIRLQDSVALGLTPEDGRDYFFRTKTFEFNSAGGIASTSDFAVPFNPGDTADAIANSIANAITFAGLKTHIVEENNTPPTRDITATAIGNRVTIRNSNVVNANGLTGWTDAEGAFGGAGATIEAIAFLPGGGFAPDRMYAASSGGGIYEVTNYEFDYGATLNLLGLYTNDLGRPASFTGLSAGPARVENGRYAQTLFATSAATFVGVNNPVGQFSPEIWTFDNAGQPSPMLLDGATKVKIFQTDASPGVPSVTTFFTSVQGITFSSLDYNPWHATTTQGSDPLGAATGNTSYYFGLEEANTTRIDDPTSLPSSYWQPGAQEYVPQGIGGRDWTGNPSLYSSYNLPGGALGSLLTKEMDLSSYSASDKPTLYFNYSLDTDNVNDVDGLGNNMTDSFRVFASSDGANWTLLGTNNSIRSSAASSPTDPNAELPPVPSVNGGQYENDRVNQQVQELFDPPGIAPPEGAPFGSPTQVQQWRQARIDLGDFAGKSGVQIRFDFSSAGTMGIGDIKQGGVYLAGVAGAKLQNNQQFTIDSSTFTFRSGFVLQAPAGGGKMIQTGETVTIDGQVFRFRHDNSVVGGTFNIDISNADTAEDVAQAIADALAANPVPGVTPVLFGDRVQLLTATTVTQTAPIGFTPAIIRSGAALPASLARTDVTYTIDMTDEQVAFQVATAMDAQFSFLAGNVDDPNNLTTSKVFGRTIRLYGHNVTSAGPLPYSNKLEGDQYGTFYSPLVYDAGSAAYIFRDVDAANRGVNNARQGVFIDDLLISFAGRGEQVINAALPPTPEVPNPLPVTTFDILPPDPSGVGGTQVTVGNYQLSIRRGTEYAQGAALGNSSAFQPGQTFDINDRLAQGITLYAIPASQIVEGSTFSIVVSSDSRTPPVVPAGVFTFEFSRDVSVAPGNYRVAINTGDDATAVAIAIRNAINGVPTSTNFGVKAGLNNAAPAAGQTRAAINLFGAADANPGPLSKTTFGVETIGFPVLGDASPVRIQGQTIVENSRISNTLETGVTVKPVLGGVDINGVPIVGTPGDTGSMVNLPVLNTAGLVPGITIKDNLIVSGGANGILFSGAPNNDITHAVPFGRIINNTIVKTVTGIRVETNASPTILNNILALNDIGIFVDATSSTTVVGANIYQNNLANLQGVAQTNAIFLQPTDPLFVNSDEENYYLAANSLAIDSSVNTLQERPNLQVVTAALGIPPSLIQAPDIDLVAQLRVDDPAVPSPPGLGSNVFKDRGALERSDSAGPTASLRNPVDNDAFKADSNVTTTKVTVVGKKLTEFVIQFNDTGLGVDASTIVAESFTVQRKVGAGAPTTLVAGVDFTVELDATNMIARIIPVQGVWSYATYTITLANGAAALAIQDKVGNSLQPNQAGQNAPTEFVIQSSLTPISPWQNPINQFDVNASGTVSGIDALLIINRLLNGLAGPINPANPATLPPPPPQGFYIDVNGDGSLSPTDALLVINYLMTNPPAPLVAPMASFEEIASPTSAVEPSAEPAVETNAVSAPSVSPDTSAVAAGLAISQMVSSADESAESSAGWVAESTSDNISQSQTPSSSASAAVAASFESESFEAVDSDLDSILDELAEESLQLTS